MGTTDTGEDRLAPEKTYPDRERKKEQPDISISQITSKHQYSRSWSSVVGVAGLPSSRPGSHVASFIQNNYTETVFF